MAAFERLSALDTLFVGSKTNELPMHVGAVLLFEAGPLGDSDGGVDFRTISSYLEKSLAHLPSVWVDDEFFDIHYHVRPSRPSIIDGAALL